MPQELLYLTQLSSSLGSGWLPAVMLGGLLLALLFKPDRIHNWPLFRFSCCFLAVSILTTPMLNVFVNFFTMQDGLTSYRSTMSQFPFIITAIYALTPILQGISILCGLLSMIPTASTLPLNPPKHPLE